MTDIELLKNRISTIAQIMKEWSEEAEKSALNSKQNDQAELYQWYDGRAKAYRLASDWLLEALGN